MGSVVEGLRGGPSWQRFGRAARATARRLAESVVPPSMLVWRGPSDGAGPAGRIALTFDDGPDPLTPEYLSVLHDLGVRATFFVLGRQCERAPDLVSLIADAGHELGAHGYTHRRFPSLRKSELQDELRETQKFLPTASVSKPFVRPPHGAISMSSMLTCARAGFTTVLWSHDSGDCRTRRSSEIVRAFEDQRLSEGDIILMHEGQRWTMEALPNVIGRLREAGHALVTVGELLHG